MSQKVRIPHVQHGRTVLFEHVHTESDDCQAQGDGILGGYSDYSPHTPTIKIQSAKICPNFNFREGGCSEPNSRTGVFCAIWSKISGSLACLCITDSLSHVETKKVLKWIQKFKQSCFFTLEAPSVRKF